jgi:2-dehydro-3-deoxy-D-arabinonate dehydratase
MKLCRFFSAAHPFPRIGLTLDDSVVLDLSGAGVESLTSLLESADLPGTLKRLAAAPVRRIPISEVCFAAPVEVQEVWAAGVTYLRSKAARMEESEFSASAYDRVYDAPRPEIFFKSLGAKVSGHGGPAGIRADAKWNVPEPELALVFNSRSELVGYTVGNDMSSRDIEGENLLYLPQAKTYRHSCALGPFIRVGVSEEEARSWDIRVEILRGEASVFSGETKVSNIKRSFEELGGWLHRSQTFPAGVVLLTGTGVVPPNEFTLAAGDRVKITISGIGTLENTVAIV